MKEPAFRYEFACVACGDCCRFPGHVLLTDADITRMARALQLSEEVFIDRYTRLASNRRQLCLIDSDDGACIFLRDNRCSRYADRPDQCRTFPFATTTQTDCPGLTVAVERPGR